MVGMVLVGLSAFLLAFAPLLKLYVAPRASVLPTDFWQMVTLQDEHASYFDAAKLEVHTDTPVVMVSTVRGDVRAARGDIAVWDNVTAVKPVGQNATVLSVHPVRYALNRHTGGLVNCCGAAVNSNTAVKQSGLGLAFPVGAVEKKTYLYFDPATLQAWPMRYEATEKVGGISAYRFVQTIPETLVEALPALPAEKFGLPKKRGQVLSGKWYALTRTLWVDPRSGVTVDRREQIAETAKTRDGLGQLVLARLDLKLTPQSRRSLVGLADDTAFQLGLERTWGPALSLVLGLVLLAGGGLVRLLAKDVPRPRAVPPGGGRPPREERPGRPGSATDALAAAAMVPGFRPGPAPGSPRDGVLPGRVDPPPP